MTVVKNDLFDYKNRYIYQDVKGFKFSIDSILLSEYVKLRKSDVNVLDLCTGNAPIPLILTTKYDNKLIGFEVQKRIYNLAIKSIKENSLENKIQIINDDIKNIGNYYPLEFFNVLICNPPYFKCNPTTPVNDEDVLSIARHEIMLNLECIFSIAEKYLKQGGRLFMVHRPERLDDIIVTANKHRVNVKEIQLVCTNKSKKPNLVLVKCIKNSQNNVIIKPVVSTVGVETYQNIFGE